MSAVRLVIFFWGALFVALDPFRALDNGDLYWQRWLGDYAFAWHRLPTALGTETFTAPGAPYVPQEWFISFLVAFAIQHQILIPLSILIAVVPIWILISIYLRARDRARPEAVAAVLLFVGIALVASFGIRAQVLGWGCFAAFLLCLERRDRWAYAAVPIVVIWANVHASVALGPVFLAFRILGGVFTDGFRSALTGRDVRILALCLPALLCTPLGWHLPAYAVMLAGSPIRQYIQEWQPVSIHTIEFLVGGLPLALLIAAGVLRERQSNWRETLPAIVLFVAMIMALRNVPLFAIAAAPLAASSINALFPSVSFIGRKVAELERFALVCIGVAVLASALSMAVLMRSEPRRTPFAAINFLSQSATQDRLFCENFNACSAALEHPNLRVFIDGRADPYPLPVWRSYIAVVRLEPTWEQILNRYRVNSVLASRGDRIALALSRQPGWKQSFEDNGFVVFERE